MNLTEALALCDHASPMPHLAGQALKVLREHLLAAQAVDVGTIREVIAECRRVPIGSVQAGALEAFIVQLPQKLTRAISGEKAERVGGEVLVAIKRGDGYEDVHPELVAEDCMSAAVERGWRYRVLTASPAPDKEGL